MAIVQASMKAIRERLVVLPRFVHSFPLISAVFLIVMIVGVITPPPSAAATPEQAAEQAARGLARRLLGHQARQLVFEAIPREAGRDVFELESRDGKIVIRGPNGVAMASGLNWYLRHYARAQVSLWGNNLAMPHPLPTVPQEVRQVSPFPYRYYPRPRPSTANPGSTA